MKSQIKQIKVDNIILKKKLGEGITGYTFYGIDSQNREYCIKFFHNALVSDLKKLEELLDSITNYEDLSLPIVIKPIKILRGTNNIGAILPYWGNSCLGKINPDTIEIRKKILIIKKITEFLQELKERNLYHSTLHPLNIFVKEEKVGITDLFFSHIIDDIIKFGKGEPFHFSFLAPERIQGIKADINSDIYSLGCITLYLLNNEVPYQGKNVKEILDNHIYTTITIQKKEELTEEFYRIIEGFLIKDPQSRFTNLVTFLGVLDNILANFPEEKEEERNFIKLPENKVDLRVLIVDDVSSARRLYINVLRSLGIKNCEEASNGEEALDIIYRTKPHIIIMDLNMPFINGFEVLARLRNYPSKPYPIVISANRDKESVIKSVRYGAIQYLTKPVNINDLKARIISLLSKRKESFPLHSQRSEAIQIESRLHTSVSFSKKETHTKKSATSLIDFITTINKLMESVSLRTKVHTTVYKNVKNDIIQNLKFLSPEIRKKTILSTYKTANRGLKKFIISILPYIFKEEESIELLKELLKLSGEDQKILIIEQLHIYPSHLGVCLVIELMQEKSSELVKRICNFIKGKKDVIGKILQYYIEERIPIPERYVKVIFEDISIQEIMEEIFDNLTEDQKKYLLPYLKYSHSKALIGIILKSFKDSGDTVKLGILELIKYPNTKLKEDLTEMLNTHSPAIKEKIKEILKESLSRPVSKIIIFELMDNYPEFLPTWIELVKISEKPGYNLKEYLENFNSISDNMKKGIELLIEKLVPEKKELIMRGLNSPKEKKKKVIEYLFNLMIGSDFSYDRKESR